MLGQYNLCQSQAFCPWPPHQPMVSLSLSLLGPCLVLMPHSWASMPPFSRYPFGHLLCWTLNAPSRLAYPFQQGGGCSLPGHL